MRDEIQAVRAVALRNIARNVQPSADGQRWRAAANMSEEEIAGIMADRVFEDDPRAVRGRA